MEHPEAKAFNAGMRLGATLMYLDIGKTYELTAPAEQYVEQVVQSELFTED